VSERIIPVTELVYNGCSGDGYSTIVNGQVYDESNPTGQELFLSAEGCDSLVSIALSFTAPASVNVATVLCPGEALLLSNGSLISDPGIYIDTLTTANGCDSVVNIELSFTVPISASTAFSICPDEPYVLSNGELADLPGEYIDTLVAANGCDSVLFIELSLYRSDTSYFTREICPGETVSVGSAEYGPGDTYTSLEQNIFGCDSLIITQLLDYPAPLARIDTFVRVTQSIISPFSNDIPDEYTISWTPAAVLSCATCPNPVVLSNEGITAFQLSLLDSIGCRWEYPIAIEYVCNVFVPNAFSPNGDGFNDLFMPYTSGCPVQLFQMEIFDRWGGRVFYSEDASTGWDGMLNGKKAEQGVYVYLIRLQEFGQEKMLTGDVVLFR
jgi:gliding motility-associated-like protein